MLLLTFSGPLDALSQRRPNSQSSKADAEQRTDNGGTGASGRVSKHMVCEDCLSWWMRDQGASRAGKTWIEVDIYKYDNSSSRASEVNDLV